jgi:hypothetical protein
LDGHTLAQAPLQHLPLQSRPQSSAALR